MRSSSRFICIDTADCVLFTTSAALVKLPVSAMAMKVRSWSMSIKAVMAAILFWHCAADVAGSLGKSGLFFLYHAFRWVRLQTFVSLINYRGAYTNASHELRIRANGIGWVIRVVRTAV